MSEHEIMAAITSRLHEWGGSLEVRYFIEWHVLFIDRVNRRSAEYEGVTLHEAMTRLHKWMEAKGYQPVAPEGEV